MIAHEPAMLSFLNRLATARVTTEPISKMACLRLAEGDGWVNWSGLAILLSQLSYNIAWSLERLLGPTGPQAIGAAANNRAMPEP